MQESAQTWLSGNRTSLQVMIYEKSWSPTSRRCVCEALAQADRTYQVSFLY